MIPGKNEIVELNSVQREPFIREFITNQTITKPGREIIRESVVQPIVSRENIDLKISRGEDKEVM